MGRIQAVISDFGGVLTSPLMETFVAYQAYSGIPLEALGEAMLSASGDGENLLFVLERGQISEEEFLTRVGQELTRQLGRPVELTGFGERYLEHLQPNQPMIDFMRSLREQGYKLAICTNNVREWDRLWRAKLPVDEIFDVVVDSAFVGSRKPEPRIYEITLERLGVSPEDALLIDDFEHNCQAAAELGMATVWFRSSEQAISDAQAALA